MDHVTRTIPPAGREHTRTRDGQLMEEALTRARMRETRREWEQQRLTRRVVRARRARRRAESVGMRARRALAVTLLR